MNYNTIKSIVTECTINGFQKYVSKSMLERETNLQLYLYLISVFLSKGHLPSNQEENGNGRKGLSGPIFTSFMEICQCSSLILKSQQLEALS